MNFDPRTSPKSSAWLGLDDLSSFDSSPHFGAFGKRKSEQVSSENPLAPRSKRPATLQLDDEPSGSDMNAASQMGTPLRGVATNQLPVEQEEDDEMLQLAAEESEPRSCPSTPVSSPQTDQQPSPTLFSAAAAENTPRPTAVQPMICTICQYSFPDMPGSTPLLRLLRCGHYFCKQHITSWFDTGRSVCPNCQCTYPSLRGRSRELSVHQLVQEEAAARRKAEFTAGDDVKAVWESDGKFYPATVVSVGEETLTVRWKDESEVDRTIRFDQVIKDSLASAGAEDQEGEVEITIKDKESGELYQATAHAMPDGLFSVCYTGAGQIRCSEKLTSAQLSRRSKDFSVCMVCGGCHSVSRSLLCDGCDSMCHLECADPPLQVVPAGKWFCNRALCRRKNAGAVRRGESADTQIASSPRSTPPAKHIAAVDTQNASNAVAKTSPKNRSRVKRIRTSFQVTNSADRANVMHTGPGDLYHVHFLGWNSRYDEAWTKAMCSEQLQDWVDDAPETCSVCGESGVLLVCDGCEAAFHLACLRPQLDHVPDGEWYCPSRACQLRPTFEKYCAEFETLARLQAAADRRFIFAGGTIADLCERLARDDLKLPPSSPLEEAHAAYPIKTRVEVNFSSGWYRGWVERHTDKSVGVRFDEDDDYYTVPLLEKPQKQGGKPAAKQCTWLLRSLEFDVEGVVKQTLSLMVDEIEDTMRNQPMIEILTDILKLVMAHGKALDLSVLTQQLLQQDQSARNLAASLESIDLQTVKRNLDSGLYTTPDEFASDMMRCLASYHTKYLAHTPIVMCADALGRCFKRLMYSFGLKKVYQDAACKQKSQKPAQRISLRSPVPRAKHNSGEPVADQQLMKDRDALLKNIKPLGKHICAQVERCLDAPTTVDDSDRVALGAKLLRGNGELIEEFTEILLRGKQRQPAVSDQKQTRKKRATFCPEADRCIEYSTDVTRGLQAQLVLRADAIGECGVADGYSAQSGRCANAAISGCPEAGPRRRVSSTSISFRPSQVAGWSPQLSRDHRRAPSITGPRQLAGRQHKVIRITESKEQVPTIGMGLSQQHCTRDAGKETAMGPLVVTQCPAGTVAFNAGVRVGMELLSFESTPQKLAIGQGDFTFVGVMEMMRASDRPWTMTFCERVEGFECVEKHNTASAASDQSGGAGCNNYYSAAGEAAGSIPSVPHLQRDQNHFQHQCCLALQAFALSQRMNGALQAKQIEEEKLQAIVESLIATGALVVCSSQPDDCAGSSSSSSGDVTHAGLAVFVEHAVLKYVLYFPSSTAAYNLYLNGDRKLSSVTKAMNADPSMDSRTCNDALAVLDAVQVVTRVSRPTDCFPVARSAAVLAPQPPVSTPSTPSVQSLELLEWSTSANMQNRVSLNLVNSAGVTSAVRL